MMTRTKGEFQGTAGSIGPEIENYGILGREVTRRSVVRDFGSGPMKFYN